MKHYSTMEIKKTARAAVTAYCGAEPKLYSITLLEASDDRTYILFRVYDIEYRFTSYICDRFTDANGEEVECVWVGDGTLERLGRRTKRGLV